MTSAMAAMIAGGATPSGGGDAPGDGAGGTRGGGRGRRRRRDGTANDSRVTHRSGQVTVMLREHLADSGRGAGSVEEGPDGEDGGDHGEAFGGAAVIEPRPAHVALPGGRHGGGEAVVV